MNIIDLKYYYDNSKKEWINDRTYIIKIRDYLVKHGFPDKSATMQERSYQLVADEKWLFTKQGKSIIKKLAIANKLLIEENSEPAMFALNPRFMKFDVYNHLIVENKAVYYRLIKLLKNVEFYTNRTRTLPYSLVGLL